MLRYVIVPWREAVSYRKRYGVFWELNPIALHDRSDHALPVAVLEHPAFAGVARDIGEFGQEDLEIDAFSRTPYFGGVHDRDGGGGLLAPQPDPLDMPDVAFDLAAALRALRPGDTLTLAQGIYYLPDMAVRPGAGSEGNPVTVEAEPDARVVITNANGGVPRLNFSSYSAWHNLWIGGRRGLNDYALPMGHHCTIEGCTLFGYYQGIIEGDGYANTYRNNRFVRCGYGSLQHPIYLASGNHPDKGDLVEGNLFVACEGWSIHVWHAPSNITIRGNFVGDASVLIALSGAGHTVTDNIFWSHWDTASSNFGGTTGTQFTRNMIGKATANLASNWGAGSDNDGNTWLRQPATWDGTPVELTLAQAGVALGYSYNAIVDALYALRQIFSGDTAALYADGTTKYYFGVIRAALDAWVAA